MKIRMTSTEMRDLFLAGVWRFKKADPYHYRKHYARKNFLKVTSTKKSRFTIE